MFPLTIRNSIIIHTDQSNSSADGPRHFLGKLFQLISALKLKYYSATSIWIVVILFWSSAAIIRTCRFNDHRRTFPPSFRDAPRARNSRNSFQIVDQLCEQGTARRRNSYDPVRVGLPESDPRMIRYERHGCWIFCERRRRTDVAQYHHVANIFMYKLILARRRRRHRSACLVICYRDIAVCADSFSERCNRKINDIQQQSCK